jgi:hypothetical protein
MHCNSLPETCCQNDGKCGLNYDHCHYPANEKESPHVCNGFKTTVWFVQGKKANRAFRKKTLPTLHRQDATIEAQKDDSQVDPEHHEPQKEKHDADVV